ncbi:MAG TPA: FtsQ-type POTRA domain-containing protein [Aestuariivirgaceae bacterium]|jgi:cell division protein FtsQ
MQDASETRIYRRRRRSSAKLWQLGNLLIARALTRVLGCLFLVSAIGFGLLRGDHLDPPGSQNRSLMGRVAPIFGHSAQTIRISGLKRQSAETVLAALGIEPGSSLFGFDPDVARRLLANIDWVEQASVRTVFPNRLEIDIVEREPFAIWQSNGSYYLIDRTGVGMSAGAASYFGKLPLVSGAGAQTAVYQLVNQLKPHSELLSKVKAAARVGGRRWNLYFESGVKVALPEENVEGALEWIDWVDQRHGLLSKGISSVDLRLADRAVIMPQSPSQGVLKVSERRQ